MLQLFQPGIVKTWRWPWSCSEGSVRTKKSLFWATKLLQPALPWKDKPFKEYFIRKWEFLNSGTSCSSLPLMPGKPQAQTFHLLGKEKNHFQPLFSPLFYNNLRYFMLVSTFHSCWPVFFPPSWINSSPHFPDRFLDTKQRRLSLGWTRPWPIWDGGASSSLQRGGEKTTPGRL